MLVTKGTWRMREQCVPGSLSSSPAREPGNEAMFHQSQISLPHNIIEKEQSQPNMTVVGTFADQESKCKETRSEKNNRLKQLLQPFQMQLIPR